MVVAGFVSDAAAGKLPLPLDRAVDALASGARSLLLPVAVGAGLGLVALLAWRSRRR